MKNFDYIYQNGKHQWAVLHGDTKRDKNLIDTNEVIILSDGQSLITDPGGLEIFPSVFTSLSKEIDPEKINYIFATHQDPDIISSYPLWLTINKDIKCYISRLWVSFITHFGGSPDNVISIPDKGMSIVLGSVRLEIIPAHYLHSSGNFHLYDPDAKILFSGDVGASLFEGQANLYVNDFEEHIKHAEFFHQRWMGSSEARDKWCRRVAELEIDMLVPQHGSIYKEENVKKFINWFSELEIGKLDE